MTIHTPYQQEPAIPQTRLSSAYRRVIADIKGRYKEVILGLSCYKDNASGLYPKASHLPEDITHYLSTAGGLSPLLLPEIILRSHCQFGR
jgi:hypothetical protein